MAAFGFPLEFFTDDDIVYWDDTATAVEFFFRIGTRWESGMNGPTGLRWEAIYPLMDRLTLEPDAWDALLDDLEVMERAALEAMREKD